MNLTMFNPACNTVDQVFENFWNGAWKNAEPTTITPRADVFEKESNLVVEVELPGVKKESVAINLEHGVLTISAEKKAQQETKAKDWYCSERAYGKYERSFRLSEAIDASSIQANFEDGVLHVEMSRKAESAARKIEIK